MYGSTFSLWSVWELSKFHVNAKANIGQARNENSKLGWFHSNTFCYCQNCYLSTPFGNNRYSHLEHLASGVKLHETFVCALLREVCVISSWWSLVEKETSLFTHFRATAIVIEKCVGKWTFRPLITIHVILKLLLKGVSINMKLELLILRGKLPLAIKHLQAVNCKCAFSWQAQFSFQQ